jgi:hypothetical protein
LIIFGDNIWWNLILPREVILNEEKGMYERYGALFGLRNQGGDEAVAAIIESLNAKSALLRHEVNNKYFFIRLRWVCHINFFFQ